MKISTTIHYSSEKAGMAKVLELLSKIGYDGIDYGKTCHCYQFNKGIFAAKDNEFEKFFKDDYDLIKSYGLEVLQVHAPFPTYPDNIAELDFMVSAIEKTFYAAQILGAPYVVMHGALRAGWEIDDDPAATKEVNLNIVNKLLPASKATGVKLALENMPLKHVTTSSPEEIIDYIDSINDENFVACLDTGHANLSGVAVPEFARRLGSRLKVLHVHDNQSNRDSHLTPFCGSIDWTGFSKALTEIGYKGAFSFESDAFERKLPPEMYETLMKLEYDIAKYIISLG